MKKEYISSIENIIQKNYGKITRKEATVIDGGPREVNDIIKHYNRGEFGNVPNPNFSALFDLLLK